MILFEIREVRHGAIHIETAKVFCFNLETMAFQYMKDINPSPT